MKMRKELNNKGFSLVELLIATIILGIVVAPLLHTFVVSAKTAARGSQLGDAVLASENIAEGVETVSISELFTTSNIESYIPGASGQKLYKSDGAGGYTPLAAGEIPTAPYHLGMKVQAGNSLFDAMVTFDPETYSANDDLLSDYSNMDAAFVQTRDGDDPDLIAWNEFKDKTDNAHALTGGWDEASAEPVRTMTLSITKDAANKVFATLDINYKYTYRYTKVNEETGESTTESKTFNATPMHYELIPQGFTTRGGTKLPNIYLIYYPLYETDSVTNDIIQIRNDAALPFKIFLVKQRDTDTSGELQYHADVEQYVPSGTSSTNYAVIYSNIRDDLSAPEDMPNPVKLTNVNYDIYRGNYFRVDGVFGGTEGDLVSKSARDRIFKTTVEIYDSTDSNNATFTNLLHTFQSTKLQ